MWRDGQRARRAIDLSTHTSRSIIWKPSAAARHLLKRKLRGHLPAEASLTDYELVIHRVLRAQDALLYVYYNGETP